MKRLSWFGLPLILAGMMGSSISWGHSHGYSHGYHNYSRDHYSGRRNFSLGIGLTNTFGTYGYPGSNIGVYGDFNYGRPYSYYRQPYYRSYNYGYPGSGFYWPAYPPVVYPSPVVVVPADPPVYIQQQPRPPVPSPESAVTGYWYYCESPAGYYPNVERCPGGWVKVPSRPAQ